jgi:hypothetical protein
MISSWLDSSNRKGPESCPTTRTGSVLVCLANQKIGTIFWQNQYQNPPYGGIPEDTGNCDELPLSYYEPVILQKDYIVKTVKLESRM